MSDAKPKGPHRRAARELVEANLTAEQLDAVRVITRGLGFPEGDAWPTVSDGFRAVVESLAVLNLAESGGLGTQAACEALGIAPRSYDRRWWRWRGRWRRQQQDEGQDVSRAA